jgi:hypothetical protein
LGNVKCLCPAPLLEAQSVSSEFFINMVRGYEAKYQMDWLTFYTDHQHSKEELNEDFSDWMFLCKSYFGDLVDTMSSLENPRLKSGSINTFTIPSGSEHANLQGDYVPTRAERFHVVDNWLRDYEERNHDWPGLAQMCIECATQELWREGGYSSWDSWVHTAAPRSARSIYYFKALFEGLAPDFSLEEMRAMKPETAKVVRKLSKQARRDATVRSAASGSSKRDFVAIVQEARPEEHVEADYTFSVSGTVGQEFLAELELYQATQDSEITASDFLLFLVLEFRHERLMRG